MPPHLPLIPEVAAIASDGRELYRFGTQLFAPYFFPFVEQHFEAVGDDQVAITYSLPESVRDGEALFHTVAGPLRMMPALVGLRPAKVVSAITPRSARFIVSPPSAWMSPRPDERPESLLMNAVLEEMLFRTSEFANVLRPDDPRLAPQDLLERAATRWRLSARQKNVLSGIVAGLSNKEIATRWNRAEVTIELHVSALFRKAGVSSRLALLSKYYALA
jgi:DNA-binding CsgD family transcriptional regulator